MDWDGNENIGSSSNVHHDSDDEIIDYDESDHDSYDSDVPPEWYLETLSAGEVIDVSTTIFNNVMLEFERTHEPLSETFTQLDMDVINSMRDIPMDQSQGRGDLKIGALFNDKLELQNTVKQYHILHHQDFDVVESNKSTWAVRCKQQTTCKWRLRGILKKNLGGVFMITKYVGPHTCLCTRLNQYHGQLDSGLIAKTIKPFVRTNPAVAISCLETALNMIGSSGAHEIGESSNAREGSIDEDLRPSPTRGRGHRVQHISRPRRSIRDRRGRGCGTGGHLGHH